MILGFIGSVIYSGIETGCYSMSRVRLAILENRQPRYARFRQLMDRPAVLLGTLLIGNNIANYLGTAGLTVILEEADFSDTQTILLNVMIVTPLLFVFGETLPKDLFARFADQLTHRFHWLLRASERIFTFVGLLPLVLFSQWLFERLLGVRDSQFPTHPRRKMIDYFTESANQGTWSREQSDLATHTLDAAHLPVGNWAQPIRDWLVLPDSALQEDMHQAAQTTGQSWLLLRNAKGQIHASVLARHWLGQDESGDQQKTHSPTVLIDQQQTVLQAMIAMRQHGADLLIVTSQDQPRGVVTRRGLAEALMKTRPDDVAPTAA